MTDPIPYEAPSVEEIENDGEPITTAAHVVQSVQNG
jgi:hypothetical protein